MTPERFEECKQVEQKINRIEEEIKIWEDMIISPDRLTCYLPGNDCLRSNIEESAFKELRSGIISHLNSLLESEKVKFKAM